MSHVDDTISTKEAMTVFDVLGDPQRSEAVRVLQEHGTPIPLDRLARLVEDDAPPGSAADRAAGDGRQSRTALHHAHLPKLDDAGVIEYDPDDRVVTELDEERLRSLLATGRELLGSLER